MRNSERGFTFMEVLVVMGIIAVLAGLTVVAMNIIVRRGPEFTTETRVKKIKAVTDLWKSRFERLPPTDPKRLNKAAGGDPLPAMTNAINVGIETLYQALYWPFFNSDPGLNDDEVGNTDEDVFDKPTSQGTAVYEIVDAWGNPLVYFVNTDYASADEDPPTYRLADGTDVTPRPWKYEDEARGFAEPNGFQIFSMGEDQLPNTEDDIKSWQ